MNRALSIGLGHDPGLLGLLVLGACAALVLLDLVLDGRTSGPPRLLLARTGLRALALLAFVLAAFEVHLQIDTLAPTSRRVALLLDTSASMSLPDAPRDGATPTARHLRASRGLAPEPLRAWAASGLALDPRAFDTELRPVERDPQTALASPATGAASDLAGALVALSEERDRGSLAAVVLVSDGLVAGDEPARARLMAAAAQLQVPVTTVWAGAPILRDVRVAQVHAPAFAFVENVTEIEAEIASHGYPEQDVTVELRRDGEQVASQRVHLAEGTTTTLARFEVAPDRVGQFVYQIAVRPPPDQATDRNDARNFVIKILRDKVRVLHVAGRPDWDVRALRMLLRRDPNVELLSYYILRGMEDILRDATPADELSLIPFPTDELFSEQLGSFDLVILHNFDPERHQVGVYMRNLAQYVRDGGALVIIGGDLGLAEGGYGSRELAPILPVDVTRAAPFERRATVPTLTDAGRRHPITSWLGPLTRGWGALPPLDNRNRLTLARDADTVGAATLLEADGRPLLVVGEPGKGRVMVLGTAASWRLGFAAALPRVGGTRPYDLLWLAAVRWLLRDERTGRLNLETDRPHVLPGQTLTLQAETLGADYAPEPGIAVRWSVTPIGQTGGPPVLEGTWTTDALGRAREPLTDLAEGAYRAVAERTDAAELAGTEHPRASRVFLVSPPVHELAEVDATPGGQLLRDLARATDGTFVDLSAGDAIPGRLPVADGARQATLIARKQIQLWSHPLALFLLLASFGVEWILRRRAGAA